MCLKLKITLARENRALSIHKGTAVARQDNEQVQCRCSKNEWMSKRTYLGKNALTVFLKWWWFDSFNWSLILYPIFLFHFFPRTQSGSGKCEASVGRSAVFCVPAQMAALADSAVADGPLND